MILSYLSQLNFGISHSVNVIISVEKENEEYVKKVIGNGLTMIIFLSIIIFLFFIFSYTGGLTIGEKYNFSTYLIPVMFIAIFTHLNSLLSNIFRVFGKIFSIALNQSLFPILMTFMILFYKEHNLLWALVIANFVSVVISFILYLNRVPIKFKLLFDFNLIKYIQKRGWHLFIYNSSFALIIITTKSFISSSYSVEEFGYFTFSFSLVNAILLFLDTLSYLISPKMINRFANGNNNHIHNILSSVRTAYISTSHFLIHFSIMLFPLILQLFPAFEQAGDVLKVIALTVILYTNSFGYQTVLLARGKEKLSGTLAFMALILNIILVPLFISLNVQFSYVIIATMIVYFIFVFASGIAGRKELKLSISFRNIIKDIFPIRMFVPFAISLILILFSAPNIFFIIPFVIYTLFNFKDLLEIKVLIVKLIKNPNFINI